jgi:uncharacterized membrane protein
MPHIPQQPQKSKKPKAERSRSVQAAIFSLIWAAIVLIIGTLVSSIFVAFVSVLFGLTAVTFAILSLRE